MTSTPAYARIAVAISSHGPSVLRICCQNTRLSPSALTAAEVGMPDWSVYLLRCGDGTFYTGIATDVARRIGEHEQGKRGAKYLRGRGPFEIVYQRQVGNRSVATKVEHRIKQWSRIEKQNVAELPARIDALLNEVREAT